MTPTQSPNYAHAGQQQQQANADGPAATNDGPLYWLNLRGAVDALECGGVGTPQAKKHFIAYVVLVAISLLFSFGSVLIAEAILLLIAFLVNSHHGPSKDLWGRFFVTSFPAHFRTAILVGLPGGFMAAIGTGVASVIPPVGVAIVVLSSIGMAIGTIVIQVTRFKGLAAIARANPRPTGLFATLQNTQYRQGPPASQMGATSPAYASTVTPKEFVDKLVNLDTLKTEGVITEAEFSVKRAELVHEVVAQKQSFTDPVNFLTHLVPLKNQGIIRDEDVALIKAAIL